MGKVRSHIRWTKRGPVRVRSHYRRRSRNPKRNLFYSRKGFFGAIGLSKKHGPYALVGMKKGPLKAKTSIGLQGHKAGLSLKPSKNTEIGVERNLTFNSNKIKLRHKKNKFEI
jgi:hypothetical protein